MEWLAYLIASRARAMRVCSALNTSMPALLINREKQTVNQSTTSQPWTVTRSINVSMKTAKTFECGSWNIRVKTSVMRFNSTELYTDTHTHAYSESQCGPKNDDLLLLQSTNHITVLRTNLTALLLRPLIGRQCPIYISAGHLAVNSSSASMMFTFCVECYRRLVLGT